jgi:TRAP-type uncharacterized transport system substrate-binding protein
MASRITKIVLTSTTLLTLAAFAVSAWHAAPPSVVVIETGPIGGSYHVNALKYAKRLEAAGIRTEIRPNPQSLETVNRINAGAPRVDIGFAVQALDKDSLPNVVSAGTVELQPLFIFYNVGLGMLQTPAALKGRKLVMPVANSASAEAARAMLKLYGITEQNTPFSYLPIAEAAAALKAGKHDAGFFMLAPANAMVRDLALSDHLTLLSVPETVGISRNLPQLQAAVIPLGAFSMTDNVPGGDVRVVAGVVNVVVRRDINPAVLYALLDAMRSVHDGQTLVSAKGDFPSVVGTALDVHPRATKAAQSGTPWLFTHFGPFFASIIDRHWLLVLVFVVISEIYRVFFYLYELSEISSVAMALWALRVLKSRCSEGHAPGVFAARLFHYAEKIVLREPQHDRAHALLHELRPVFSNGAHG